MKTKNEKTVNQQLRALRAEKKIRDQQIAQFFAERTTALDEMKQANLKMQYQITMLEHKFSEAVSELRNTTSFLSSRVLEDFKYCETKEQYRKKYWETFAFKGIMDAIKIKIFDRFVSNAFNKKPL
jgi:hypothetical protein